MQRQIALTQKWSSAVRSVAQEIATVDGRTLDYPGSDPTTFPAVQLSENVVVNTGNNMPFTSVVLKSWPFIAPAVLLPNSLITDTSNPPRPSLVEFPSAGEPSGYQGIDVLGILATMGGQRLALGINPLLTTGSGSGQPLGCTACTVGATTAGPTAITLADLSNLYYAFDGAYRADPSFAFMMNSATAKYISQIVSSTGQPIFDADSPLRLFGEPVVITELLAFASTAVTVVAGAWKQGYVVRTSGVVAAVLVERYADALQTGVIFSERIDSSLISVGSQPAILSLKQHA